jgi:hypothetical protein
MRTVRMKFISKRGEKEYFLDGILYPDPKRDGEHLLLIIDTLDTKLYVDKKNLKAGMKIRLRHSLDKYTTEDIVIDEEQAKYWRQYLKLEKYQ